MKPSYYIIIILLFSCSIFVGCGKSSSDKMDDAIESSTKAAVLYNQQQYIQSLASITEAVKLNSEIKRDSALGENYLLLALCQRKLGQYDSSISSFKISLDYFHLVGDQKLERRGRIVLAELFYALGRHSDALSLASDAAGEAKIFSDIPNETHALLLVVKASQRMRKFPRASSALDELFQIESKQGSEVAKANLLKLSFQVSTAYGDIDRIRESFHKWISFASDTGDSVSVAESYAAWGKYQSSIHNSDSSLRAYSQALTLVGGVLNRKLQTEILTALGVLSYRSTRFDNAKLYFEEALSLARQENNLIQDRLLSLILVACDWRLSRSNTVMTSDLAKRCFDIASSCQQVGYRYGEMFAQYLKGVLEYQRNDTLSSRNSFAALLHLDEQNILPDIDMYAVQEIVNVYMDGERSSWTDPQLQSYVAASRVDDVFRFIENVNLRDIQNFFCRSTLKTGDIRLDHTITELQAKRNALKLLEEDIYEELSLGKRRNPERLNLLNKLYPERVQEFLHTTQMFDRKNVQWLVSPKPLLLKEVRDSLPSNTALIEFALLSNQLNIIVAAKDTVIFRTTTIARDRLLTMIGEYNRIIGEPRLHTNTPDYNEAGAIVRMNELSSLLYNTLLDPIFSVVSNSTKVYIVLPKDFGWLPIHTLRIAGGMTVGERISISYLPSAAALFFQQKQENYVSNVVGLGHSGKTNWDVEYELKDIRSFYDKAMMFFDTTSTLEHLKPYSFEVLHLAAEFTIDPNVPDNSTIVLSDGISPYGLRHVAIGEMCSFAFPQTFVFSNISPIAGGLSRYAPMAFLASGSRTVITSMWQGERKAKKYFGEVFYTNLMGGMPATKAYQQAVAAMAHHDEFGRLHRWGLFYQFGK